MPLPRSIPLTRLRKVKHLQMAFGVQRPFVPVGEHAPAQFTRPGQLRGLLVMGQRDTRGHVVALSLVLNALLLLVLMHQSSVTLQVVV